MHPSSHKNSESDGNGDNPDAMNTKRDVEQSPDEKTDQDFPNYPHHPSKEQDMDKDTATVPEQAKEESRQESDNNSGVSERFPKQTNEASDLKDGEQTDALKTLQSEKEEIGVPQNVSDPEIENNPAGTHPDKLV